MRTGVWEIITNLYECIMRQSCFSSSYFEELISDGNVYSKTLWLRKRGFSFYLHSTMIKSKLNAFSYSNRRRVLASEPQSIHKVVSKTLPVLNREKGRKSNKWPAQQYRRVWQCLFSLHIILDMFVKEREWKNK